MIEANIEIISDLKLYAEQWKNQRLFFNNEKDFTRKRKLPHDVLVLLIVNMLKRSLSIELQEFFEQSGQEDSVCTKSAFTQQRMKLDYNFFSCWNAVLVNSFYQRYKKKVKRWKQFRVIGVDGSTAYLINKPEVINCFGVQRNKSSSVAMGRIMCAHDVLNEITIAAQLLPIEWSEQMIVNSWIPYYEDDMLFIYDRAYPGYASIYLHLAQERPATFVMRCRSNFNNEIKEFVASQQQSQIVKFAPSEEVIKELHEHGYKITKDTKIKVRLVKVLLDTGETEILITNLYNEKKFRARLFKELYFMRWGVETSYATQKNILQLESFSGQKPETILQDFHSGIFVSNLQSVINKQCESKIKSKTKHRKHRYKTNRNVAMGLMKNRIVNLFLEQSPQKILEELEKLFLQHLEPVRPNRQYKRVVRNRRLHGKYQTFTNYKRVI